MKKMGSLLIIIGVLLVVIGLALVGNKKNTEENQAAQALANQVEPERMDTAMVEKVVAEAINKSKEDEIQNYIKIAISDGVLTDNEKNTLRSLAKKQNLSAEKLIQQAEDELKKSKNKQEVEKIDYSAKNGLDFEKFIVAQFDKKYLSLKHWAGDKYTKGRYDPTTPEPDLIFEFQMHNKKTELAVECKWRKSYYKGGFELSEKDFEKYQTFEKTKQIPVFIAIGIGGAGENPEKLYAVPLREMKSGFLTLDFLKKYEKQNLHRNFYFDSENLLLK
jgi:uncharacterized membrane protein